MSLKTLFNLVKTGEVRSDQARRVIGMPEFLVGSEIEDQPPPKAVAGPAIQDLVLEDVVERKRIGIERYGQPVLPFNGRDALVDAYQEALDLVMYLRQAIYERDHPRDLLQTQEIWHGSLAGNGVAVCGADYPNMSTTTVRSHVTCPSCLRLMG
jgi:hypothetical protein